MRINKFFNSDLWKEHENKSRKNCLTNNRKAFRNFCTSRCVLTPNELIMTQLQIFESENLLNALNIFLNFSPYNASYKIPRGIFLWQLTFFLCCQKERYQIGFSNVRAKKREFSNFTLTLFSLILQIAYLLLPE